MQCYGRNDRIKGSLNQNRNLKLVEYQQANRKSKTKKNGANCYETSMAKTSLITACMAYQAYEINKLKDEERVIKISSLLLNVSDVRYEAIDKGLQEIINQLQKVFRCSSNNHGSLHKTPKCC